jgi:threonyl-tRNA synthetase
MRGKQTQEEEAEVIVLPTNDDTPELLKIRHSSAHIMAMAVQRLFREQKSPPCRKDQTYFGCVKSPCAHAPISHKHAHTQTHTYTEFPTHTQEFSHESVGSSFFKVLS